MKTTRLVLGILCCIIYPFTCFVSCSEMVTAGTDIVAIADQSMAVILESITSLGIMICGAIGICTKNSSAGSIVTGSLFLLNAGFCFISIIAINNYSYASFTTMPLYLFANLVLGTVYLTTRNNSSSSKTKSRRNT